MHPSSADLARHHLTEAIRHLAEAAEFVRELRREDSESLAMVVVRTSEVVRDVRAVVTEKSP
jgi:hypothetical protein